MYYVQIYYGFGKDRYIIRMSHDDFRDANLLFDDFCHFMEVDPIGLISEIKILKNEAELRRRSREYNNPRVLW